MITRAAAIAGAVLLGATVPTSADIVHLRGGGRIECIEAWIDQSMVYYRIAEGTLAFPIESLDRIEKTAVEDAASRAPGLPDPGVQSEIRWAPSLPVKDTPGYTEARAALGRGDLRAVVDALSGTTERSLSEGMLLGFALIKLQRWGEAVTAVEPFLVDHESDALLNYYLGLCHYHLGHDEQAVRFLRRSLEIEEDPGVRDLLERLQRQSFLVTTGGSSRTSHFILKYDSPQNARLAQQMLDSLERSFTDQARLFSYSPSDEIQVILTSRHHFYDITRAPEWTGGINDGRIYLPIGGLEEVTEEAERVLRHELVHSFLRMMTKGNLPVWLNEGISMYVTGEKLDDYTRVLAARAQKNQLVPLAGLDRSFKGYAGAESAELAYGESLVAASYLANLYGFEELNRLLRSLGEGTHFEDALRQRYKMDVIELERNVRTHLLEEAARHPGEGIRIR